MINRVILEGRLGTEPEKFVTESGRTRVRFSLPLFNPFKKENDPTEWIQCEIWNQPAEYVSNYAKKGFLVSVDGRLRNQKYEDQNGVTKYRPYIAVDRVTILEPRNRTENTNQASSKPATSNPTPAPTYQSSNPAPSSNNIDDLFKDFDGLMNN